MRRILLLAPVVVFQISCNKTVEKENEAAPPVQVTAVTQATMRRIVSGDGVLYPIEQANVTPKISAPVQKFYVNRGDHVKQGQLLAVLENRDLTAAAAESQSGVAQAESNLRSTEGAAVPESVVKAKSDLDAAREARDNAKKILDSRQKLFDEGALAHRLVDESQLTYSQAQAAYQSAQEHLTALQSVSKEEQIRTAHAQVQAAKSHYESVEAQASYSRITSPIAGVIADRPLNIGEVAAAGAPLLAVMNISKVVARVNVPQSQAGAVKLGQSATVTQPGAADQFDGKVNVVSPATDPNTTTVQVWIEIDNTDERLKPGTAVHAAISTEVYKAATVVPIAAILPGEEGGTAVLTVSADSIAHKRSVKVGVRDGKQVQILSGVNPGEEVVVVGGLGIDDKTKVKIVNTAVEESDEDEDQPESAVPAKGATKDSSKPQKP